MAPQPSACTLDAAAPESRDAGHRLDIEFDTIVESIYRAATGIAPWIEPLGRIAEASAAWVVGLGGVDKASGALKFTYRAGARPARAHEDYVSKFHRIDPRLDLLKRAPVGQWIACKAQLGDAFVANDPFYSEFVFRYGSRHLGMIKLAEDRTTIVAFSHHRACGQPAVSEAECAALERLSVHLSAALRIERQLAEAVQRGPLRCALLDRARQPAIMLDRAHRILYSNEAARAMLARGDPLLRREGVLACRDTCSEAELARALGELMPSPGRLPGKPCAPATRRLIRLRRAERSQIVPALLQPMCPGDTAAMASGAATRALLVIHQPGSSLRIDPEFLAASPLSACKSDQGLKLVSSGS